MEELKWGFSRREKIGLFGIATIILFLLLLNIFWSHNSENTSPENAIVFQQALEKANQERVLIAKKREEQKKSHTHKYSKKDWQKNKVYTNKKKSNFKPLDEEKNKKISLDENQSKVSEVKLDFFNPNTATFETFKSLGIPERTAQTIINFRLKGGKFLKAEDLKVVYGITEKIFQELKDYVLIPKPTVKPQAPKRQPIKIAKVEMNQSNAEDWMKLRGIGPTLSARIIKYRDKLGGFVAIEQLQEVYNLPDSTFNSIKLQLILDYSVIKKSIPNSSYKELISHPYITKSIAGKIISKMDRNEKFKNWKEFQNFLKITPKELRNIQHYFTIS